MSAMLLLLAALAQETDTPAAGEDTPAEAVEESADAPAEEAAAEGEAAEGEAAEGEAAEGEAAEGEADGESAEGAESTEEAEPAEEASVEATKFLPSELGSSTPMLGSLLSVVTHLENAGNQITAMQMSTIRMDKPAVEQHLLAEGSPVYFTVVGDPNRVEDIKLVVLDPDGKEVGVGEEFTGVDFGTTEEGEALPVPEMRRIKFTPTVSGYHTLQVEMKEGAEDWGVGFYTSVLSYGSSQPITIVDTLLTVVLAAVLTEAEGVQVQAAAWTTVSEGTRAEIALPVDTSFSECMAFGTATGYRAKKLDFDVYEPGGSLVDSSSKGKRDTVTDVGFIPNMAGNWRFGLTVTKMQRGVSDSHAAMIMGCMK